MGEARRKAKTREERVALSIARKAQQEVARREEARLWWAGLTDEQKAEQRAAWREKDRKRANARMMLVMAAGIAMGGE